MVVGICRVDLLIPEGDSLKDKRKVLRRAIERTREKFGVSVAEVGDHELYRRARIGLAVVGNDKRRLQSTIDGILAFMASAAAPAEILRSRVEFVHTEAEEDWKPMAAWEDDEDEEDPER